MAAQPKVRPTLESGDRMTAAEFMRRYEACPDLHRVELIEGVVYMPSPIRTSVHGRQHGYVVTWLSSYCLRHAGLELVPTPTVRLDPDNTVEPDLVLRKLEGGTSNEASDGYLDGAPELVVEIAASSRSRDLHDKLNAYRRNGVREYIVWRTEDGAIDWFELVEGAYQRREPDVAGIIASVQFPGLRLDVPAILAGDLAKVAAALG
jgi:Uma2 family endonuclease